MNKPTRRQAVQILLALPFVPRVAASSPSVLVAGVDVGADRLTFSMPGDELFEKWIVWCETREPLVTLPLRG